MCHPSRGSVSNRRTDSVSDLSGVHVSGTAGAPYQPTSVSIDLYTLWHGGMPPRPRRAGARRGSISPELQSAIRAEAERLAAMPDPVLTTKAVGDLFAAIDRELDRVAKVRLKAVRELRRGGWSYDRIAAATGLSKGRVAQLVKDDRQPASVRAAGRTST